MIDLISARTISSITADDRRPIVPIVLKPAGEDEGKSAARVEAQEKLAKENGEKSSALIAGTKDPETKNSPQSTATPDKVKEKTDKQGDRPGDIVDRPYNPKGEYSVAYAAFATESFPPSWRSVRSWVEESKFATDKASSVRERSERARGDADNALSFARSVLQSGGSAMSAGSIEAQISARVSESSGAVTALQSAVDNDPADNRKDGQLLAAIYFTPAIRSIALARAALDSLEGDVKAGIINLRSKSGIVQDVASSQAADELELVRSSIVSAGASLRDHEMAAISTFQSAA